MSKDTNDPLTIRHKETTNSSVIHITETNFSKIKHCLNTDFENIDICIITGNNGNGGTYLLSLIANELLITENKIIYVGWYKIQEIIKSNKIFESELILYPYILIDDANCLYENYAIWKEIYTFLTYYISKGGKLIFTWDINSSLQALRNFELVIVETRFPPLSILKKIVEKNLPEYLGVFNHFGKTLYDKLNTIREFESSLMTIKAMMKLKNVKHISNMEDYVKEVFKTK